MPDSFPPLTWGPPFDERDLDALLSGHLADTPLALRQVADALAALSAAPTPAELTGEAAARAEFRALAGSLALGLDEAARTDGHPYAEVLSALTLDGAGRSARPPARHRSIRRARGAGPGGPTGPHRGRPGGRRLGRRGGVVIAVAGGALIAAIIALAGNLPGSAHHSGGSSVADASSAGHSSMSGTGSQNVQAKSASPEPSSQATPTHSAQQAPSRPPASSAQPQANKLCRNFYAYFLPPWPHGPGEEVLYQQLYKLAGDPVPFNVNSYCGRYVRDLFPDGALPRIPQFLVRSLPGTPNGSNVQQGTGNGPGQGTMNGIPVNN
jgi:hypothetical protein